MSSEVFNLAILLTLKDAASSGLDRFAAKLRTTGAAGEHFRSEFEKIREDLNRDLAIGGAGITGLNALSKGVKVAADFQTSIVDLRNSISEVGPDGKVNYGNLAESMQKAEQIAMRLGNALPGTTEDFVQMMQVLKQNGLDTQTILNGAADAVGNLAVANDMLPKDIAADFAQYGNLFKLRPEDFTPAADVFSRIYTSTGQTSAELVEAAKYFQGRAGTSLGIGGLKDAEQITRLFGLFGKRGLRGSMGGTMLTDFFSEYQSHGDRLKELQSSTGIKLEFFDEKGKFAGMDRVFEQMKQFDKLSDKDRSSWMEKIFGLRGMSAANVFAQEGTEGWQKFNAEQDKTISLAEKNSEKSKTFNLQLEALQGTAKNLVTSAFGPMLPQLTDLAQKTNDVVSKLQEFSAANPGLMKTLGTLAFYGATAMTVYSAFKTLTTGVRMFRLASQFSRGDSLVGFLNSTNREAIAASTNLGTATTRARGLKGALSNLAGSQTVKIGVQIGAIMGIEYLIGVIQREVQKAFDAGTERQKAETATNQNFQAFQNADKTFAEQGTSMPKNIVTSQAATAWFSAMQMGLSDALPSQFQKKGFMNRVGTSYANSVFYPITAAAGATNPFLQTARMSYDRDTLARGFQKTTPQLADSRIMTEFLRELKTRVPTEKEQGDVRGALAQAFPEAFSAAMKQLGPEMMTPVAQSLTAIQDPAQRTADLFNQLPPPIDQTNKSLTGLSNTANRLPQSFNLINSSANGVSNSLDLLGSRLASWQPPATSAASPSGLPTLVNPPGFAVGGTVTRSGLAFVHADEDIVPARAKRYEAGTGRVAITYAPKITFGSQISSRDKADFAAMLYQHKNDLADIVADEMGRRRIRA